jgi:phosphate transport system protein
MSRLMDAGLEQLTAILFKMGAAAERAISTAVEGYLEGRDVGDDVHDLSDLLSALTVTAEDKSFNLIVRYQPVASDLRIINSYIKIAYDLERYGRYAWDISFTHRRLANCKECPSDEIMEKLTEKTLSMVETSIKALNDNDVNMAKTLASTEKEVDELYGSYLSLLSQAPPTSCLVCNLLVSRYLERIADHATYIGESIIFIATGQRLSLK